MQTPARTPHPLNHTFNPALETIAYAFIIAAVVVAFLYFGRDILVPLALASLLSFSLWPLIKLLRKAGAGRATSVLAAVLLAIAGLVSLGAVMAIQMADLASELPRYESNLRGKVRALKGASMPSGAMEKAADAIQGLQDELKKSDRVASAAGNAPLATDALRGAEKSPAGNDANPVVVELHEQAPSVMQTYQDLVKPLLSPLTTTALVILFLIFILMQREDLRDRLLRIAGGSDLQRSTMAMNDAAERLSRFFLIQLAINTAFGFFIGIGLVLIGVPNPIVWGLLAGLMRFVPYVGSIVAAIFPIALAAAVDPSWTMVLSTIALFLIAEPLAGQVIEPMLIGQSTGLSPVAVVVAALFWTLMWGPVGLLLSTPLTVCLVVLGKHVPALAFFAVVLGDEPALDPEQRLYQRLLAGDAGDAAELAEDSLQTQGLIQYYEQVAMKSLAMAHLDAARGRLDRDAQSEVLDTVRDVTIDLEDYALEAPAASGGDDTEPSALAARGSGANAVRVEDLTTGPVRGLPVRCVSTRSAVDEAAAQLLAQLLKKSGVEADVVSRAAALQLVDGEGAISSAAVCLSHFGSESPFQVRTLIRRLKQISPHTPIIAAFWMLGGDHAKVLAWQKISGADYATSSLSEAVTLCLAVSKQSPEGIGAAPAFAA